MERRTAFVTGATRLLGSNLLRELVARGWTVRALVRSREKGEWLLGDVPGVELMEGDMLEVEGFAPGLEGADAPFNTAAHFREAFGRGDHWPMLEKINVKTR